MFCRKCGKELPSDSVFCISCGVAQQAGAAQKQINSADRQVVQEASGVKIPKSNPVSRRKKTKAKFLLSGLACGIAAIVLVVFIFISKGTTFSSVGTIEGSGYANPEAVMKAYLDALKTADLDAMISTFAVETFAKNYDLKARVERVRAYSAFNIEQSLPSSNKLTSNINVCLRKGFIARSIQFQYMNIFMQDMQYLGEVLSGHNVLMRNEQDIESLMKILHYDFLTSLNSIQIIEFVPPESISSQYSDEGIQESLRFLAYVHGADKVESVAARVRIDNRRFLLFVDTICYGGKWYMLTLGGRIGNALRISDLAAGVVLEEESRSDREN